MIAFSETLRAQLLDLWVRVTDAGGAVGFVAPADPADPAAVARLLDASLARVSSGEHVLGVIRRDQTAVGMGFLVSGGSPLRAHWRTVLPLMVDPALQGTGAGRILLDGLHGLAAELGLEHLMLTVRGGLGIEGFDERLGYRVVGSHPRSMRVAPGDDRRADDGPRALSAPAATRSAGAGQRAGEHERHADRITAQNA